MTKSAARGAFELSLVSAEALVGREVALPLPLSVADDMLARGLRAGAAVLMVACFEHFLRNLFTERLAQLAAVPPARSFADLPDRIRVTSVFGSLDRAMRGPLHMNPPPERHERIPEIAVVAGRVVNGILDIEAFANTGSNPDASQVAEMFRNAEYPDLWTRIDADFAAAWPTPIGIRFVRDKLDEIVLRRHIAAHTADALSYSSHQLTEGISFLRTLAQVLDDHLEAHVAAVIAGTP